MIDHDELAGLIPALVLRTLSDEEWRQVLLHLKGCAGCRDLAARMARGVDALALEPEPVEPSARLRSRVLAAVAAERQDQPEPRRPLTAVPRRPRFRSRIVAGGWQRAAGLVAAAFLVGLAAGVGLTGHAPGVVAPPPVDTHGHSEVGRYPLHGTGAMAAVSGSVVLLTREGVTLVDFKDLPPLASNQVYELWMVSADQRAAPAVVFVPDAQGSKVVLLTQSLRSTRVLAVTVEPGPTGSLQPTQQPQLRATLG